ncbi:melanopsin-like [Anneissia japonica]|uniref:melanopsin-like n=1 Tax=Anneissia japonica TaxID=1529436 RepID=UPI00142587AA|nr:melanopsin-like [Anneissia japonica]XP_033104852.1 melanopsin-like [Anneissia japonica]XP_033104853.1 melanopsin-like [Anneissia japonica]XP_033104854.1 melanopsin-like [Anneissia japonica]
MGHYVFACLSLIIGCLGLVANAGALYVFQKMKMISKTVTHSLLFHQCLVDFMSALVFLPLYPIPEVLDIWQDQDAFCKTRTVYWILAVTSTANMVYLTIERYYSIVLPMRHLVLFRGRTMPVALPVTYVAGVICSVHSFIVSESDELGVCDYNWNGKTTLMIAHGVFIFIIEWMIPTTIFIFVYSKIYLTLKLYTLRSNSNIIGRSMVDQSTQNVNTSSNKGLVSMVLVIFITYLVCWTPKIVLYLLSNCGVKVNTYFIEFTVLLLTSNVCWNPFIYAFKYKEFNIAAKRTWREVFRRKPRKTDSKNAENLELNAVEPGAHSIGSSSADEIT